MRERTLGRGAPKEQIDSWPSCQINSQAKGPHSDETLESPLDTDGANPERGKSLR